MLTLFAGCPRALQGVLRKRQKLIGVTHKGKQAADEVLPAAVCCSYPCYLLSAAAALFSPADLISPGAIPADAAALPRCGTKEMDDPVLSTSCHLFGCSRCTNRGTKEMAKILSDPPTCHLFGCVISSVAGAHIGLQVRLPQVHA